MLVKCRRLQWAMLRDAFRILVGLTKAGRSELGYKDRRLLRLLRLLELA
jgi:hypothetical protein